jgi:hypothetical protein
MSLSDDVRKYCKEFYVDPAKSSGEHFVTIRAGTVHMALNYKNRHPLVCSAIGSNIFEIMCNIKRISIDGPLNGANTSFTFEL